jgi:hypothetical protein
LLGAPTNLVYYSYAGFVVYVFAHLLWDIHEPTSLLRNLGAVLDSLGGIEDVCVGP